MSDAKGDQKTFWDSGDDDKQLKKLAKGGKYEIKKMETNKSSIPLRAAMKEGTLPRFPFSMMLSGSSGSGKTNMLMNMLHNKDMYGDYFHYIIVYSPTANKYDDTYKVLDLPPENFIPKFGAEDLDRLVESREALIDKKGVEWVAKNARVLIILDDVIANRKFLESETALLLFSLLRHYLCSIVIMMQSYTKLPRGLRVNCNAMAIFPTTQSEIEVLLKEITPAGIKKREFEKVIDYCTSDDYSFLFINRHAPKQRRIRKNLDEDINLNDYKVKGKLAIKAPVDVDSEEDN